MAVDSRSPRPPGVLAGPSPAGDQGNRGRSQPPARRFRGRRRGRGVRRVIRSFDAAAVIGVFCVLMILPSGVRRLASSDTLEAAGQHGTVSVLEIRGPSDRQLHPVWVWRPPGPDSATIPVLYFLHGYPGTAQDPFAHGLAQALNKLLADGPPPV